MNGLRQKSEQNWQAGELCFGREMFDAAASRFYYATFQAVYRYFCMHPATCIDIPTPANQSKHIQVERGVASFEKDIARARRNFKRMKSLRVTADYDPEPVNKKKLFDTKKEADKVRKFFLSRA